MQGFAIRFATAAAVAALLAGCTVAQAPSTETSTAAKHLRPLSYATVGELQAKGMAADDPILIRIYKQDSDFEVWKRRKSDGRYAHFKTYKICKWSGDLGPKVKEGDRQSPEGFYAVTPGLMNPNSAWYLSFDVGYPNSFDRSFNRTGSAIMVHGNCSSRGCFSMTDAQMQEIYSLMRDAFRGGQKAVQVQSYPFRMTAENMAKHRNDPHIAFWRNLKQGSDHFEVTRLEPKVDVCGRRYVFDAAGHPRFEPSATCPRYDVKPEIATAVAAKAKQDEREEQIVVAKLEKGLPAGGVGFGSLFASADKPAQTPIPAAAKPEAAVQPVRAAQAIAPGALRGSQGPLGSQPAQGSKPSQPSQAPQTVATLQAAPAVQGPQPVPAAQPALSAQASLFSPWTRQAAQPAQAAPSASALVAPAGQTTPAAEADSGGVKGFFNRILGRDGGEAAAPVASPAGEAADPAMPLPAPKPRQKSAMRQEAAPL